MGGNIAESLRALAGMAEDIRRLREAGVLEVTVGDAALKLAPAPPAAPAALGPTRLPPTPDELRKAREAALFRHEGA